MAGRSPHELDASQALSEIAAIRDACRVMWSHAVRALK